MTARLRPEATVSGEVRRSFATLGGGVSVRVVPELAEHPGVEDDTKSWQGAVDVGVRVCLKMCRQLGLEVANLAVQFGDDGDHGAGGRRECCGDGGGSGELFGAQRGLNFLSSGIDVALSPSTFECRPDL